MTAAHQRQGRRPSTAPQRVAWGTISRQRIVDEATKIVVRAGYDALSIRGLATALGVAPMSLYRHISNKDDLLDDIVDGLLEQVWQPAVDERGWLVWTMEAADILRRFLVEQPAALQVYLNHPVVSPSAVNRMKAMIKVLQRVTGDESEAHRAYAAIQTYTIGFAALEASRSKWHPTQADPQPLAQQLAAYATPEQFAVGLSFLLEGINAAAQATSRPAGRGRQKS